MAQTSHRETVNSGPNYTLQFNRETEVYGLDVDDVGRFVFKRASIHDGAVTFTSPTSYSDVASKVAVYLFDPGTLAAIREEFHSREA